MRYIRGMPDTPAATTTRASSTTPTPVPTTVRSVTASKKTPVRKNRSSPPGDGHLASLEVASREHTKQLAECQRQLTATQEGLQGALERLGEVERQVTRLRFTVPEAKVPLTANQVRAAIAASSAQWFECLRDFHHGKLKLKATAQVCAQQYLNLSTFVQAGLQLVMIDNPTAGA